MSGISVVIPAVGLQSELDETLLSVLEIRRANWQVIVVCDEDYEDPYDLADEVTFMREFASSTSTTAIPDWPAFANVGLENSFQDFVCLLMPGSILSDEYVAESLELFAQDDELASVSPRLVSADADSILGAGLTRHGRRVLIADQEWNRVEGHLANGPTAMAGIYRTDSLRDLGGWNLQVHAGIADVELASRLARAGYEWEITESEITTSAESDAAAASPYQLARDTQRMVRSLGGNSFRPFSIAAEVAVKIGNGALATLFGRIAGCVGALPEPSPMATEEVSNELPQKWAA